MQKVNLLRRGIGGLLLFVASFLAWNMASRYADQLLWGYRPLVFYLSLYGGLLAFLFRWGSRGTSPAAIIPPDASSEHRAENRGGLRGSNLFFLAKPGGPYVGSNRLLALATLSGALLGLGFPGYLPFPFLLLVAFFPLLWLRDHLASVGASNRRVFFYGFHAFLIYNILATYWVTNTAFAPGLVAVVANAGLMGIPWLLFHLVAKRLPRVAYLSLPAFWLTFEWIHHNWELNWPWLTLGNGFAQYPSLIQWYEWTGALGGSLWILLVNLLLYRWWKGRRSTPASWGSAWPWIVALLLPMTGSLIRFYSYEASAGDTITVASIQPNFEPHFEKFTANESAQLDTFLSLSTAAVAEAGGVDYLLYPETSFSYVEEDRPLERPALQRLYAGLRELEVDYLVTGWDGYYVFRGDEPRTKATRRIERRDGSVIELEAINGALQIDLETGETQTYRKGVFVPGAESFPFRDFLFFMKPLVDNLGGSVEGRGSQEVRSPLVSARARVAPVICYESDFGAYFTGYVREGAQAIFVMTNDGWWDNTAGHRQHLYLSSLRAIETRRDVVRSANMGACAFIDQRGVIQSRTIYGQIGYLNGEMRLNDTITFYVQRGDYLARIAALLSIMLLLSLVAGRLRRG